jgi:diaminopimelate decarboxylase
MGARPGEATRCELLLNGMLAGAPVAGADDPRRELAMSIAIGCGRRRVDAGWALGHTWQVLYPAIVARVGADGLAPERWPVFHRLAAEMERVAFGPGPGNAARLLALIDGGLVCLDHVAGGTVVAGEGGALRVRSPAGALRVDRVVDAVLAPPGVVPGDRLVAGLIAAGHARVATGRRGLDVDAAGGCRGRDGDVTPGLAAIGRVTEDVVVGNDTLSRTLHPTPDLWARAIVEGVGPRAPGGARAVAAR